MKTTLNTIKAIPADLDLSGTGWTVDAFRSAHAAIALDRYRFVGEDGTIDETAEVLFRHGEDVGARYPDSVDLARAGVDLIVLLEAAVDGLDMDLFGKAAAQGLDLHEFSEMLAQKVDSMEEVNANLEALLAGDSDVTLAACPIVRAFSDREADFEWTE